MTNRCENPACNRPFGLVRFGWRFGQFCSSGCRDNYKRQRDRNKAYWRWPTIAPGHLSRNKNNQRCLPDWGRPDGDRAG